MGVVVKLEDVVEALEYPDDWECYLDLRTGEIITITEEERDYVDDDHADLSELDDWQQRAVARVRQADESTDLLPLPDKFDLHEWEIMRRFSNSRDEPARHELLDAIHGSGAFRLFRHTLDRLGLREAWFAYRDTAVEQFARDWLEVNGIAYTSQRPAVSSVDADQNEDEP